MKILIDIAHPAHVHFFKNPIRQLSEAGHEILITSREKEIATSLLDDLNLEHKTLSRIENKGATSLLKELFLRDYRLLQVTRKFRPDAMAAIGGIFIAHVGFLTRIPSIVFYDTENATMQNLLTYPLASAVHVPSCYQSWLPKHHFRYEGYHELSYLHPDYFSPDKSIAIKNGLSSEKETWLIRTVSWQANHDLTETGWSVELLKHIVHYLIANYKVLISSESKLPEELQSYSYQGKSSDIHHVMAYCKGFIGESATMASECAVLGVPAIYAANTGRGYTDEQESRYKLVKNIRKLDPNAMIEAIDWVNHISTETRASRARHLIDNTIDVSQYVVDTILETNQ